MGTMPWACGCGGTGPAQVEFIEGEVLEEFRVKR